MIRLIALTIFLLLLFAHTHAVEQSIPKKLSITFEEYPPYEYSVIGGVDGHTIRKIKKIAKDLGIDFSFVAAPMTRGLSMAKNQEIDLVLSIYKTKERQQYLRYIDIPLDTNQDRLFSLRSNTPAMIDSYEKLLPYPIGFVANNSYGDKFDHYPGLKKEAASYHADSINRLCKGRVPYIVMDIKAFHYFRESLGLLENDFIQHPLEISNQTLHLAFSKTHPHAIALENALTPKLKKYLSYKVKGPLLPICKRQQANCGP